MKRIVITSVLLALTGCGSAEDKVLAAFSVLKACEHGVKTLEIYAGKWDFYTKTSCTWKDSDLPKEYPARPKKQSNLKPSANPRVYF